MENHVEFVVIAVLPHQPNAMMTWTLLYTRIGIRQTKRGGTVSLPSDTGSGDVLAEVETSLVDRRKTEDELAEVDHTLIKKRQCSQAASFVEGSPAECTFLSRSKDWNSCWLIILESATAARGDRSELGTHAGKPFSSSLQRK